MAPSAVLPPTPPPLPKKLTPGDLGYLDTSNDRVADYAATELRGDTDILTAQYEAAQKGETVFGDWRDDFFRNGYYVVKGAIPRDRADGYRQDMLDWFQKFDGGFDIHDRSTWVQEKLPMMMKGGMIINYCAAHEKWAWAMRT